MKKIAWQRGLFRIYITIGFVGLIFLFLAGVESLRVHRCKEICRENQPLPRITYLEPDDDENQQEFHVEDFEPFHSKEKLGREKICQIAAELMYKHQEQAFKFGLIAFCLIVLPWCLHWAFIPLIRLYRWLVAGFHSEE